VRGLGWPSTTLRYHRQWVGPAQGAVVFLPASVRDLAARPVGEREAPPRIRLAHRHDVEVVHRGLGDIM